MLLSTLTSIITLPVMLSIMEFEATCTNRSLINQLVSSDFVAMVCYILMVHTPLLVRHLIGPFPVFLCQLEFLIKNVITLKFMFSLNFRSITRYILVFKAKNPTAVQDDFWVRFLCIWSVGCSIICQASLLLLPGREPMTFYLCAGKMPRKFLAEKVKNNAMFNMLALVTLVTHIIIHTKLTIHKRAEKPKIAPTISSLVNATTRMEKFNQQSLFSLASNVIAIIIFGMSAMGPMAINRTDPTLMNIYPNYLWVYMHQHITTSLGFGVISIFFLNKKPMVQKLFVRNMKDFFHCCKR